MSRDAQNVCAITIVGTALNELRTPTGRRQPVGYLKSVAELNPGQPETNPNRRLEWDLKPGQPHANPTPWALDHTASQ